MKDGTASQQSYTEATETKVYGGVIIDFSDIGKIAVAISPRIWIKFFPLQFHFGCHPIRSTAVVFTLTIMNGQHYL